MKPFLQNRALPVLFLLIFWAVAVAYLDRVPTIHNDETSILAAGHKLFQEGVYGLDMYAGYHGRERIYLEVMPLMSWLQGFSTYFLGVGVWQMRFVPVVAGLLTMALTYALACLISDRRVGVLALLLLLFWQWTPGQSPFWGSGLVLVDVARVARYDMVVAPLSVGVLWSWIQARRTSQQRYYFVSGLCVGLAGLTHLYGLFWVGGLGVLAGGESRWWGQRPFHWRRLGLVLAGLGLAMAPWLILVIGHWPSFVGQFGLHQTRFDLWNWRFYASNIWHESERYFLGLRQLETWTRGGFWLVAAGIPSALWWLGYRVRGQREPGAWWLLGPGLLFPLLLAVLVQKKQFGYLMLVIPFWVTAVAWMLGQVIQHRPGIGRWLVSMVLIFMVGEGVVAMRTFYASGPDAGSPAEFWQALSPKLPENGRILGPQTYWVGLPEHEYRSFVLVLLLSRPGDPQALSLTEALTEVAPDVILVHPTILTWVAPDAEEFWAFMAAHQAQLIGELVDYEGELVQIYQLDR